MTLPSFDCGKVTAITAATKANLTAPAFSCVARAAGAGFRCARTTATTFDIFYRLQVTNFGLLKSAPNGLNYMDIRRLFLHGRCRLPDLLYSQTFVRSVNPKGEHFAPSGRS